MLVCVHGVCVCVTVCVCVFEGGEVEKLGCHLAVYTGHLQHCVVVVWVGGGSGRWPGVRTMHFVFVHHAFKLDHHLIAESTQ